MTQIAATNSSHLMDQTNIQETDENCSEIRKTYRNIRNHITENRLDFIDPNSDAIENTLDNIDNAFKNVKKPREAVSDSHILLELAILGRERIKNVACEFRSFNNIEFLEKIKEFMAKCGKTKRDPDEDEEVESDQEMAAPQRNRARSSKANNQYVLTKETLANFGAKCMDYFRVPPRPTFLIGSLDKEIQFLQIKQRQQRKQADKDLETVRTKIKELDANTKETEENSTVNEIERIFKILKRIYKRTKQMPICLYTFMVHPTSFSRTIENIFYVSFLVKDGFAKISLDQDNLPVIEPMLENEPKSFDMNEIQAKKKTSATNIQSMVNMTKLDWQEVVKVFNIETPVIPDPAN